mmetsp:Transcript_17226/g.46979  ORF Transcript_17226/g.46979 Transcript_17226/m.46979 type:complete len:87 (-) Transcript_17226:369-629(-)
MRGSAFFDRCPGFSSKTGTFGLLGAGGRYFNGEVISPGGFGSFVGVGGFTEGFGFGVGSIAHFGVRTTSGGGVFGHVGSTFVAGES